MSNGLEKIISQIEEEAKASADQIIREARDKETKIRSEAKQAAAQIKTDAEQKSALLKEDVLKRSRSAANMQRQRAVLSAKQKVIDEVIAAAGDSLNSLGEKEYFTIITELLNTHVLGEKGRICFNKKDLDRLPEGFEKKIGEIASAKGGSLTLDKNPCAIDGGFVLAYGGIEENCSFANLFSGSREKLTDALHGLLFAK